MANEQLTIGQDKARLSVIGKSWPDMNFDSGPGLDLSQIIFEILIDLDIPMPDIDLDDLDDIPIIPGLDIDTEIPTLEYPDPDWPDDEIPPIIDWPMPDLDWDDFIDKLEDLDLDLDILKDLSFVGLNDLELPTLVSLDMDFNIQMDELPASIEIVTPPNKLKYQDGERIDLTGMVVTAKKTDGSTWTSAKYPNGHIPLGELIVEPMVAGNAEEAKTSDYGIRVKYCKYEDLPATETTTYTRYGNHNHDSPPYDGSSTVNLNERDLGPRYEQQGARPIAVGVATEYSVLYSGTVTEKFDKYHLYGTGESTLYDGKPDGFYDYGNYFVHNQKTVWVSGPFSFGSGNLRILDPEHNLYVSINRTSNVNDYQKVPEESLNVSSAPYLWTAIYGEEIMVSTVSISWVHPNDKRMLSTSFEIEVNDRTGGGGR